MLKAVVGRITQQTAQSVATTAVYCDELMQVVLEQTYLYAKKVAEHLGDEIMYYQLGNELNHFVDKMPSEYDAAYIEALGKGVLDGDPDTWRTIVNVFANWIGWADALTSWLESSSYIIDIIAIDHYPGTWTPSGYDDWTP